MSRACFLCGATVVVLRESRWVLPVLGERAIGFGACGSCGAVLQSPSVDADELRRYYAEGAVYTNPGRAGAPAAGKVRDVERQIAYVREVARALPASAFQVGSSDGYTLSAFRAAGVAAVAGLDPSAASCELARERYGIDARVGAAEDEGELAPHGLWILTHVLEHLPDPASLLRRAWGAQPAGGWCLVEVPLLEREERLPPGYFSFEHVNYFTEASLVRLLEGAGYETLSLRKDYAGDLYPVVSAMARRGAERVRPRAPEPGEAERARTRLARALEREQSLWEACERRVRAALPAGTPVRLWGAGIHTSQLLAATDLARYLDVRGLLDSSPQKWGQSLGTLLCSSPAEVELGAGDAVVISSYASEEEIYRALEGPRRRGARVVRLHGGAA